MKKGEVTFKCSDSALTEGFEWAKKQALSYSHEGDPVGDWYEAALPSREAFCMRDVSHHLAGAQVLGLAGHTKNMLLRFAQSISESRDFCCFWEINRYYSPAPVDYTSDADFWYNLPANFDVLDACWRAYKLTGDADYVKSIDFRHFYKMSMNQYINFWDKNKDGAPERRYPGTRKGIPGYEEGFGHDTATMCDLIAAEARAFFSYSEISRINGKFHDAARYEYDALNLITKINQEWWDEAEEAFYFAKMPDGSMKHSGKPVEYMAYFDVIPCEERLLKFLDDLDAFGKQGLIVEKMSHYPEIFYKFRLKEQGEYWLRKLIDPQLERRDYPEVSFAAVGAYIFGMMGITPDWSSRTLTIDPQLPDNMIFAEVNNLPIADGTVDVDIEKGVITVENRTSLKLILDIPAEI